MWVVPPWSARSDHNASRGTRLRNWLGPIRKPPTSRRSAPPSTHTSSPTGYLVAVDASFLQHLGNRPPGEVARILRQHGADGLHATHFVDRLHALGRDSRLLNQSLKPVAHVRGSQTGRFGSLTAATFLNANVRVLCKETERGRRADGGPSLWSPCVGTASYQ